MQVRRLLLSATAALLIAASGTSAWIRHVPQDLPTIQGAINVCFEGDTVLIEPGTYAEYLDYGGSNITVGSLFLTTGDTTFIDSTILDGNSRGTPVSFLAGEDRTAVLAGFTITGGYSANGGAIKCFDSSPTIRNNKFIHNNVPSGGYGGAILCDSSSSPLIKGNEFQNNRASYGGAIACLHSSHPQIENNHFQSNIVPDWGGAIYAEDSNARVIGNTFTLNEAHSGAAIYFNDDADGQIIANQIYENSAYYSGGAIYSHLNSCDVDSNIITDNTADYNGGGISVLSGHPAIEGNFVRGNFSGLSGGGVDFINANVMLKNNIIRHNSSDEGGGLASWSNCVLQAEGNIIDSNTVSSKGGGILVELTASTLYGNYIAYNSAADYGGAICFRGNSTATRNIIIGNSASRGGAIFCNLGFEQSLIGNVITGNNGYYAGAIYSIDSSETSLSNCILWENSSIEYGEIYSDYSSIVTINYSDVTDDCPGIGNISTNPLFRDPAAGDFHLMANACGDSLDSPCIDAGSPGLLDSLMDCSWGLGTRRSDMGAYGGAMAAGRTLNVPRDYDYIQDAVFASSGRDTILVQPGVYYEHINYQNKNIIIASMFMLTGDTSYIYSTIIDGDSAGVVVTINNNQDSAAALIGFTIRNGYSDSNGGGIYCGHTSIRIYNNIIRDNISGYSGGGIYCSYLGDPDIRDNIILHNRAISPNAKGGGIFNYYRLSSFTNNVVAGNEALGINARGGGVYLEGPGAALTNNVIADNWADSTGGGIYCNAGANIKNAIIWGNDALMDDQVHTEQETLVTIDYSDIQNGWDGEGNLDVDPLFRDPLAENYMLQAIICGSSEDSPCIDKGDPLLEDGWLDCEHGLGDSRSDMGAFGGISPAATPVENENIIPQQPGLLMNYPNPFNDVTMITFNLPTDTNAKIELYDVLGRKVKTIDAGYLRSGIHNITWKAGDVASGIYFYILETQDGRTIRKCLLLR